jgi:hypothetical protein
LFSKEMNALGKTKTCPHCGKSVKLGVSHGRLAAAFIPIAVVAVLLGLSGPLAAGIAGGVGALFGMSLKKSNA